MRVDPEPTLKGAETTLNRFGIHAFVRQDEVMPTPYERPVPPAEARAAERRAARPQLTRPAEGKVIAGVAIGLAHHLGWPVRWIRLAFVLISIPTGAGLVAYVFLWALTPQSRGTFGWGGVWGHSWFIDPAKRLSVVSLSNTALEGMMGRYIRELRDAIYADLG